MANNILTTATFATAFLKPDPGESIDSIWGRKIADNTGYVYYRPQKVAGLGGIGAYGSWQTVGRTGSFIQSATTYFTKFPEYNTLYGSYAIEVGAVNSGEAGVQSFYNGNALFNYTTSTVAATSFRINISSYTNFTDYKVSGRAFISEVGNGTNIGIIKQLDFWLGP